MMEPMALPQNALERVQKISDRTGISVDEIRQDYFDTFNDPFIQTDNQFSTDEERHTYCIALIWTRYVSRPPVRSHDIIPVGFDSIRTSKKTGELRSSLYSFVKEQTQVKLRRIVLPGQTAYLIKEITPFAKYTVKLGKIGQAGDLIADNRSKFEDPIMIQTPRQDLINRLNAKLVTLENAMKFPSRTGSTGYTDTCDWRVIRGIIARSSQGQKEDGSEWGVYTIADATVNSEPKVAADGTVLRPGMTCWISPHLMAYGEDSECDFYGSIQVRSKTGEAQMNAYMIQPVHAKRLEVE